MFQGPGTAGRVDRTKHAEFFLQDNMGISCYTAGEFIPLSHRFIIGLVFVGIYAAHHGGEHGCRISKHIDTGIKNGAVEISGTGMDTAAPVCFFCAEGLHDIGPYFPGSPEFGDFNEEYVTHIESEINGLGYVMNGNSSFSISRIYSTAMAKV